MLSYTALYGLYVLTSTLLFYALLLLARYVKQTKAAPEDADFEMVLEEKQSLLNQQDQMHQELITAQNQIKALEAEIQNLKAPPAPPEGAAEPAAP